MHSIKIIDYVEEGKGFRHWNKRNYIHTCKQTRKKPPWTNYNHSHELRYRGKKEGKLEVPNIRPTLGYYFSLTDINIDAIHHITTV